MQDILGRQDNDGGLEIKDSWRMQVDEEPLELVTRKSEERGKRDESWSRSAGRKKRQSRKVLTGRLTHFDAAVLCLTVCCSELTEQTHSADLLPVVAAGMCPRPEPRSAVPATVIIYWIHCSHTGNTGGKGIFLFWPHWCACGRNWT